MSVVNMYFNYLAINSPWRKVYSLTCLNLNPFHPKCLVEIGLLVLKMSISYTVVNVFSLFCLSSVYSVALQKGYTEFGSGAAANIRSDCSFVKNLTKEVRAIYRPFGCNLLNSDPVSRLELEPSLRWMSVGTEHRTYSNPCTGNGNTSIQLQDSQAEWKTKTNKYIPFKKNVALPMTKLESIPKRCFVTGLVKFCQVWNVKCWKTYSGQQVIKNSNVGELKIQNENNQDNWN